MKRREFLLASVGASGAVVAASGQAAGRPAEGRSGQIARWDNRLAQEDEENDEPPEEDEDEPDDAENNEEDEPANDVITVELVDYAYEPGTDETLTIEPGTTVRFVWMTDTHNIVILEQPDESDWEGVESIEDTGYEHEHTFEVEGTYEFVCTPHEALGMFGTIEVVEDADAPAVAAPAELDPHDIGVPLQKHFIGIATFFAIFLTLVFTFYVLKYGETPHSGYPNNRRR